MSSAAWRTCSRLPAATRISVTADSFHAATRSAIRAGEPTREISSANSIGHLADGLVPLALEEHVLDLLGLLAEAHPRRQLRVVVLALRPHPADVEREHGAGDGEGRLERLGLVVGVTAKVQIDATSKSSVAPASWSAYTSWRYGE